MKLALKTCLSVFLITLSINLYALKPAEIRPAYEHLSEVNKQWNKHREVSPLFQLGFTNDNERIKYHLLLVKNYLSQHTPAGFSGNALKKRAQLLDILSAYANAENFPTNKYHKERQPYFIDDYGVHCAVGYLISESGHTALSYNIRSESNYAYIHEIKTKGLKEWADEHGFTVDELAWIQPGYQVETEFSSFYGGANGDVTGIYTYEQTGFFIMAGNFDLLGGVTCRGIGLFKKDHFENLGDGVEGVIRDVVTDGHDIYVCGDISFRGMQYHIACWKNSQWTYFNIPDLYGAKCTSMQKVGDAMEVVFKMDAGSQHMEVWKGWPGKTWERKIRLTGLINDIESGDFGVAYAGAFDTVFIYEGGAFKQKIGAKNAIVRDSNYIWHSITKNICDTVFKIKEIDGLIYFGGRGHGNYYDPQPYISAFNLLNDSMQAHITRELEIGSTIYEIEKYNDREIIIGGDFRYAHDLIVHYPCKNLVTYQVDEKGQSWVKSLGYFDSTVTSIEKIDGEWILGGRFTKHYSKPFDHLARIGADKTSIMESDFSSNLNIYPNPASHTLTINLKEASLTSPLRVTDLAGRTVISRIMENLSSTYTLDVSGLKNGMYILELETPQGRVQERFNVQK